MLSANAEEAVSGELILNRDSELVQILPGLPEKFVIDFANGIDVAHDHIRVQRSRGGRFDRFCDGFTGKGAKRQAEINASLADGIEGSLIWLQELTHSLARSNLALARVNLRLSEVQLNVAKLAHYSEDTRARLEELGRTLSLRCDELARSIALVDFEQRAARQLAQVFDKWAAGRLERLPLLGRLYAVLDELWWGVFGDFCRAHPGPVCEGFFEQLADKATIRMGETLRSMASSSEPISAVVGGDCFVAMRQLLAEPPARGEAELSEALGYLGDWADPWSQPFVFVATQRPEPLPVGLPRLLTARRAADAMVKEVFKERADG